jgi:hypothetical protein
MRQRLKIGHAATPYLHQISETVAVFRSGSLLGKVDGLWMWRFSELASLFYWLRGLNGPLGGEPRFHSETRSLRGKRFGPGPLVRS